MRQTKVQAFWVAVLATVWMGCAGSDPARGQADAAARRDFEISVFGGPSGVFTGLDGSRSLSITGGLDVGFHPLYGMLPAAELRGLYPVQGGSVDEQKNVLGGLRMEKRRGGLRLYGDMLFGRGQIDYESGGFLNAAGTYRYIASTSNVLSPGGGVSFDLTPRFSLFGDVQFQRYDTPVTASGTLWSKPVTVGATYRLPFLRHGRPY